MEFFSSAPARVCLYGEHQDYLSLKVITAAINLRLNVHGHISDNTNLEVYSKDIDKTISIPLTLNELKSIPSSFISYIESGYLAVKHKFPDIHYQGIKATISSNIPLESGLSSSAALLVAWIKFLVIVNKLNLSKESIAQLAYEAEHNIMGIPCGMMDQYASALGNLVSLDLSDPRDVKYAEISPLDASFIVVNSNTPKKTNDVHAKIVTKVKGAVKKLEDLSRDNIVTFPTSELNIYERKLSNSEYNILKAVLQIRDDTRRAEKELTCRSPDIVLLGQLLTSQQHALREGIGVSIPILDKIVEKGIEFGALGGKLTGAGLGGCVVLLAKKENGAEITTKIKKMFKLPTWSVEIDSGIIGRILK